MKQRPGIIIYREMFPTIQRLSDNQAGILLKAIISEDPEPDLGDDPVLYCIWPIFRQAMEADMERYEAKVEKAKEAGKLSAERRRAADANERQRTLTTVEKNERPLTDVQKKERTLTTVENESRNLTNVNERQPTTTTTTTTSTTTATTSTKECRPTAPVRHRYGIYANVLLSDEEYRKIREEFPKDWKLRVDRLSEYMQSKGVSYKDHLATIRAWARRDGPVQTQQPGAGRTMDADEMAAIKEIMRG